MGIPVFFCARRPDQRDYGGVIDDVIDSEQKRLSHRKYCQIFVFLSPGGSDNDLNMLPSAPRCVTWLTCRGRGMVFNDTGYFPGRRRQYRCEEQSGLSRPQTSSVK